jgi:hypothetical protein
MAAGQGYQQLRGGIDEQDESHVRFDIIDNGGKLSGTAWVADPKTAALVQVGAIEGTVAAAI